MGALYQGLIVTGLLSIPAVWWVIHQLVPDAVELDGQLFTAARPHPVPAAYSDSTTPRPPLTNPRLTRSYPPDGGLRCHPANLHRLLRLGASVAVLRHR